MQLLSLSIRVDATNPDHHLWNNNGTWWCHYTLHREQHSRRCRVSLETRLLSKARLRRDHLFNALRRLSAPNRRPDSERSLISDVQQPARKTTSTNLEQAQ